MRDDRLSPVESGDRPEVDREGQVYALTFLQAQPARIEEHAGRAQVDRSTSKPAASRQQQVHNRARTMTMVLSAFHGVG